MVREGGCFVIRHQGQVVASHPVLAGRAQLSVRPEHGPGAVARNLRHRYGARPHETPAPSVERDVEVRDLSIYEQLLDLPEVA